MCPDVADKADSGTKPSAAVRTWKSSNNRRACLRSTGFADVSWFVHRTPDQVAPGASLSGSAFTRLVVDFKGFYGRFEGVFTTFVLAASRTPLSQLQRAVW